MKTMKPTPAKPERDYQAEGDLDTLMRGEEIKTDPKRHKKALAHGKKQVKKIRSIADLKKAVKHKLEGTDEEEAGETSGYEEGES